MEKNIKQGLQLGLLLIALVIAVSCIMLMQEESYTPVELNDSVNESLDNLTVINVTVNTTNVGLRLENNYTTIMTKELINDSNSTEEE